MRVLNKYYKPNFKQTVNDNYITLTTHNRKADLINKSFLSELKSPSFFYEAQIKGEFPDNMFPIEKTLELKGVFENIVDAYIVIDINGDVIKMNNPATKLLECNQQFSI
mgnify:CR=1 FL=1